MDRYSGVVRGICDKDFSCTCVADLGGLRVMSCCGRYTYSAKLSIIQLYILYPFFEKI
jgi:hypothetical protein